jgi:hypothetical protein
MKRLIDIGFQYAGKWVLKDGEPVFEPDTFLSNRPVLYVFIVDDIVRYTGKSKRSLVKRMGNYRNDASQSVDVRVAGEIKQCLEDNKSVAVYALFDSGLLRYGPFSLNLISGLEDGIIDAFKPDWNQI